MIRNLLLCLLILSVSAFAAERTLIKVEGMSSNHCVEKVTDQLKAVKGVDKVEVSLKTGIAIVEHSNADTDALNAAVEKAGFKTGKYHNKVKINKSGCEGMDGCAEVEKKGCCDEDIEKPEEI